MTNKAKGGHDDAKVPADLKAHGSVDPELGMTKVRASSGATVRMVRDESVLEVPAEDVAAHARMGFRLAGEKG